MGRAAIGAVILMVGIVVVALFQVPALGAAAGFSGGEDAEETAAEIHNFYTNVIEDLVSYMDDPDYERAEQQRVAMVEEGKALMTELQTQTEELQAEMEMLQAQASAEPTPTPSP